MAGGSWSGACTKQPSNTPVHVQGGWQEARGNCGSGEFYIENVRELVDSEGEWFLDETTDELVYFTAKGSPASQNLTFVASTLTNVIELRGNPGQGSDPAAHVNNVTLRGLTIAHAATTFLEQYEVPSGGDWSIHRGAAVFVDGAEGCTVEACLFDQPGGNGLMLSNYVAKSTIVNNSFIQVGDSAILAVGSSKLFDATCSSPWSPAPSMPTRNLLQGNLVDTVGVFGKQTAGYFKALSDSNRFVENVLVNGPRSAVNFNDGGAGGEVLEGNLMLNFVRESGDHGMFNSWDRQPYLYSDDATSATRLSPKRHQIHRNLCFNHNYATTGKTRSGYCFDYDDGSSQYNATANVMVGGGFKIRDGVNRSHADNLVVNGRLADPQVAGFNSTTLTGNIVLDPSGSFYSCVGDAFADGTIASGNSFYVPGTAAGAAPRFMPGCGSACKGDPTLSCWQKHGAGYDGGSTIGGDVSVDKVIGWAKERLRMV